MIRPRSIGWRFRVKPFDSVEPEVSALTTTTITSCPRSVDKDEAFEIRGQLVVKEDGSPIEAGDIKFSYDSVLLGTDLTDANGEFVRLVKIGEVGTWNVSARFDSVPGKFGPSSDNKTVTVSEEAPPPVVPPGEEPPEEEPPVTPPGEEPPPPDAPPCPFRLRLLCRIWRRIYG